jgi:ketosteroid isomerase-like protein
VPTLEKEASAIHDGDVEPRMALWSRTDPMTLFGAVMTRSGWDELEPAFVRLAGRFSGSESFRFEVMAAGVSGDLSHVAGIARSRASRAGGDVVAYALRVTTILRREDAEWRVVHRHGDQYDEASRTFMP